MKKRKANLLATLHLTLIGVLLALIVSTPLLVREGFSLLDEEVVEAIVILVLTLVAIRVFALYRRQIRQKEDAIAQFARHAGTLNLQVEEIRSLFQDIEGWSREQRSLQQVFALLADRVLGVVNSDWVVLRMIESESGRTLTECSRTRARTSRAVPPISNRRLLQATAFDGYSWIGQDFSRVMTCCVFPEKELSESQTLQIRLILHTLSLLYFVVRLGNQRGQA